jgi:hypothetical protein
VGIRVVNGNDHTEDGWPLVDQAGCNWITVPGTDVHLQIQTGQPTALLGAWAADWNAYIEPLRDADSACWTEGNSVLGQPGKNNGSNHLGGTAIDLNWESHPFQQRGSLNSAQMQVMAEMEAFYEKTVFWAGRWDDPVDEMHSQCGYNSFNNPHTADFIARKIRADGFSRFRRGDTPPPLSRTDRYALAVINEGKRRNISPKGIQIALTVPFVESGWKIYANSNVPESLAKNPDGTDKYPHDAVGSDHDSNGLFQQRMAWGPLSVTMDPAGSAGLFYDGGQAGQRGLTDFDYNSDARTPGGWAQAVQVSAFPDRYDAHWNEAVDLYNRLAGLQPPLPPGEDELSADAERMIAVIYQEVTKKFPSRSPLRHLDEGVVDTMAGFLLNTDSSVHVEIVKTLASLGHKPSLALLWDIAHADPAQYPDRQTDRDIAQRILADVTSNNAAVANESASAPAQLAAAYADNARLRQEIARLQAENARIQAAPAPVSAEVAVVEPKAPTIGEYAGRQIDAGQEWMKVSLAMDKLQQHALDVSIQGLKMQANGTEQ